MKRFKKVYIEVTNVCNLRCSFCPKTSRQPQFMSQENFRHIIRQVKPFTDYVYFHLMGEPLLHKELSGFLEICNVSKLKVNLTTNGILIQSMKDVLLKADALRKVSISLHSYEANELPLTLEEYLSNVVDFVHQATTRKIICELRLWNADENRLNEEIIKILEKQLGLPMKEGKIKDCLYLGMAERFDWPDMRLDEISDSTFCYGLKDQIGILVDGTVVPCCLDSEGSIALGNVYKQEFGEIMDSSRAKSIMEGFSNRKAVEELCRKCGYSKKF